MRDEVDGCEGGDRAANAIRAVRADADSFPPASRVPLRRLLDEERGASYVPVLAALFAAAALLLLMDAQRRRSFSSRAVDIASTRSPCATRSCCSLTPRPPRYQGARLITLAATVVAVIAAEYLLPLLLDGVPGVIWVISQRSGRIVVGPTAIVFASSLAAIVAVISGAWPAVATSRTPDDAIPQGVRGEGLECGPC